VNPRYRIYAAVGLGGVVLLALVFHLLGSAGSSPAAAPVIKPKHPLTAAERRARQAPKQKVVRRRTATKVAKKAPAKAKAKPVAKAALAPPKVAKTNSATDGVPASLSSALAHHSVVVVSLVVPDAPVDEMAYAEAKAGAAQAGAGFVRISAASNDDVQALSTLVDTSADAGNRLLDSPAVLIFRQPHDLYVRINGYVDADTIAQAAANAAPASPIAPKTSALASAWVTKVNAACTKLSTRLASESFPSKQSDVLPFLRKLVGDVKTTVNEIRVLKPPPGKGVRVAAMLAAYDRMFATLDAELDAAQHRQFFKLHALQAKVTRDGALGDQIAAELGASTCSGATGG
jgi:hypothetical protein